MGQVYEMADEMACDLCSIYLVGSTPTFLQRVEA